MSDHFFGLNIGDFLGAVQIGTATTGTTVELRTHDGAGLSKAEIIRLIEVLRDYNITASAPV